MSPFIQDCVDSWKRVMPDYEIKCWNEQNFDVNSVVWVKEALENKKWSLASDYIRHYALYTEGGIYMDTDVKVYKKIMQTSNAYYNQALSRAGVRDLSGAVESLKKSLRFNKKNIQARNLLGLVYFEMGETVSALSEWVISKNFKPENNIAGEYLDPKEQSQIRIDQPDDQEI